TAAGSTISSDCVSNGRARTPRTSSWWTITEEMTMAIRMEHLADLDLSELLQAGGRKVGVPHPAEIRLHEVLEPMGITQYRLAKSIGVPQRRIGEIVIGIRGVTVDTGLRLSRFFGMSEGFWTGLQVDYDAAQVKRKIGKVLDKIEP